MSSMLTSVSMADVIDPQTAVLHIPKMIRQDTYGYRTSVEAKDVQPVTVIPLGQAFPISKPGAPAASSFNLRRFAEGYYSCNCPAWKFSQERDKMRKTCTHLEDVLGAQYENERIAIAKEANSTIFEHSKFRRTTSDGHHARHTHAKSVLDDHYRQLSQSQDDGSSSQIATSSRVVDETRKTTPNATDPSSRIHTTSTSKPSPRNTSAPKAPDSSDTETEEEEVLASQAGSFSRPVITSSTSASTLAGQTRLADENEDGNEYGYDSDDVQMSPSKRARRGKRSALDSDDDKVSLLLAKPWQLEADPSKPRSRAMDPTGWWISEKLDGVRAFWDGQRLYSRQKIEWNAPAWWKNRLPKDITLDGELWMARGLFNQTSQICRTTSSNEWNRIKFMVFDSPSMGSQPVEERWAELERRFGSTEALDIDSLEGPQIKLVKHIRCQGREHLNDLMKSVEGKGGEGLMLRQPGSKYEGKRGNTLFKLKSWYDAEAEVIGYAEGTGKHERRVGSLVARMACGTVFRVGTGMSDAQRDNPPPIGSIINYRFFEITEDGNPRFPAFRGVAWDKTKPKDAELRTRAGAQR